MTDGPDQWDYEALSFRLERTEQELADWKLRFEHRSDRALEKLVEERDERTRLRDRLARAEELLLEVEETLDGLIGDANDQHHPTVYCTAGWKALIGISALVSAFLIPASPSEGES